MSERTLKVGKDTREKILKASATLFSEHGYAGTSTRDIATAVGISQPGLYRHFPTKADIYLALAEEVLQPWLGAARQAEGLTEAPDRKLLWLLKEICQACVDSPYEFAFLITSSTTTAEAFKAPRRLYAEVLTIMGKIVQDGIDEQAFRPVDVEIALHMCMSLTDLLILPMSGSASDKIDEILALTAYGLIEERTRAADALSWASPGQT